ncbi:DUF1266 domain-containing protein [Vibrio sonorensis]|uniref:DUF1266 domain-containing protein n=1 Tax=Vibrio sonorensis TaxID=1004316 RepID=UPI0008D9BB26|nr:DUF1266 domain-containing protein [Vibrio sonorensis]
MNYTLPKEFTASKSEHWTLTIAVPHFQYMYHEKDYLELGIYTDSPEVEEVIEELQADWEIVAKQEAIRTILLLLRGRFLGDMWKNAVSSRACQSRHKWKASIDSAPSIQVKEELSFIDTVYSLAGSSGFLAWDLARGCFLARQCYYIGWLSKDEVRYIIHRFAIASQGSFASWRQFTNSFVLGRHMMSYRNDDQDPDDKIKVLHNFGYSPGYQRNFAEISKLFEQGYFSSPWDTKLPKVAMPTTLPDTFNDSEGV